MSQTEIDGEQFESENPEINDFLDFPKTQNVQIFFRDYTNNKIHTLSIQPGMLWIEVMRMYIQKTNPHWTPVIGETNLFKYLRFLHGGFQICEYDKQVHQLMDIYKFGECSTILVVVSIGHRENPLKRDLDLNDLQDLLKSVSE